MAESTTLTIRINDELKRRVEAAAVAEDRSVTDFVVRAVKGRIAAQCATCGRSDLPNTLSGGFTPDFAAFLERVKTERFRNIPIVIITIEGGQPRVYRGLLKEFSEDDSGAIPLVIESPVLHAPVQTIRIPRGVVVGWDVDQDGSRIHTYVSQGYSNGTEMIQALLWASVTEGRPRR